MRDLGASWSPRGTVCMTHRRVAMVCHLLIQSPAALQVDANRQRLRDGNSEIKPHFHSFESISLTVLFGLGIVKC